MLYIKTNQFNAGHFSFTNSPCPHVCSTVLIRTCQPHQRQVWNIDVTRIMCTYSAYPLSKYYRLTTLLDSGVLNQTNGFPFINTNSASRSLSPAIWDLHITTIPHCLPCKGKLPPGLSVTKTCGQQTRRSTSARLHNLGPLTPGKNPLVPTVQAAEWAPKWDSGDVE